jgi:hypothetical protein
MALKSDTQSAGAERRRHTRLEVATAVMVSPNGHANHTTIFDISESGARIGLPTDFEHGEGALMRLYFPKAHGPMVLFAEIKRVAIDHVGVEFVENQQPLVNQLLDELSED